MPVRESSLNFCSPLDSCKVLFEIYYLVLNCNNTISSFNFLKFSVVINHKNKSKN